VIFSLPENLISQPVQTQLGWHLIEVTDIEPSSVQPLEAVRDEVERDLRDRRAERRQIQVLDDLLAQSFEHPDSLVPAARATGLETRTTDWFSQGAGDGVAEYRPVREAAFSTAVRRDGRNSEAVDLPDGSTVVLRVQEVQEPRVLPLEEVAGQIREILQQDAAMQAARDRGDAILAELADGRTLEELAADDPEAWRRSVSVNRTTGPERDVEMPRGLRDHLFQMTAPGEGEFEASGATLAGGDYAVVVLESVRMLEPEEAAEDVDRVADDLQAAYASAEMRAYLSWLEEEASILRYPENLE
jgi:peptidyl-prolyl cis-trans isomerase D